MALRAEFLLKFRRGTPITIATGHQIKVLPMAINPLNLTGQAANVRSRVSENAQTTQGNNVQRQDNNVATAPQDTVKLSGAAQTLQGVEQKLANTPDVDQKKVDRLKAEIESGQYKVNAEKVAEGFMSFEKLFS
ncbi:flagellar biosynthesis anti-sigma factor FlgM [Marinobacterium sp. CAU 1594]|nr:flagellar biosynthesis anti-sigma factor FlgM [Marinobacterium arenosum]